MRLIQAVIHRYDRFSVSGRETLVYEPTLPIQLIIGQNGAGKSSLIFEIFPLASSPEDYSEGGYKHVTYEHEGKYYTAKSYFKSAKTFTHELWLTLPDGSQKNLNDGGTAKVHNENVERIFGITPALRLLLLSVNEFSSMETSKRRELFTSMSDVDFTFALSLYKRIQKEHSANNAVLKYLNEHLIAESNNVVAPEQIVSMDAACQQLRDELQKLYAIRTPYNPAYRTLEGDIAANMARLREISDELLDLELKHPLGLEDPTPEEVTRIIRFRENELVKVNTYIDVAFKRFNELKAITGSTDGLQHQDLPAFIAQRNTLEKEIHAHRTNLSFFLDYDVDLYPLVAEALASVYIDLTSLLSELPNNDEKYYSKSELDKQRAALDVLIEKRRVRHSEALRLNAEIRHLNAHAKSEDVHCPMCTHTWKLGFDQVKLDQAQTALAQLNEELEALEKAEEAQRTRLQQLEHVLRLFSDYLVLTRRAPSLAPLWARLQHDHLVFVTPRAALSIVQTMYGEIEDARALATKTRELKVLSGKISQLESLDLERVAQNQALMEIESAKVSTFSAEARGLKEEIASYKDYLARIERMDALHDRLQLEIDMGAAYSKTVQERTFHELLDETIRTTQNTLNAKETQLFTSRQARDNVDNLNRRLEATKENDVAIKLLLKFFSPSEGFIAKGLTGFISNYLSQMNKIIASIWSYPLVLLPVDIEDGETELTYRFPVQVASRQKPLKDIIEGSRSMKQVVDLAFRIVAMKYLRLEHLPLFLDEFGTGFDEAHKTEALRAIRKIVEQLGFEQVFIISHDSANYGSLANAELCVLCEQGVVIPPELVRIV